MDGKNLHMLLQLAQELREHPWKLEFIGDAKPETLELVLQLSASPFFQWTPFGGFADGLKHQAAFVDDLSKIAYAVTSNRGGKTESMCMRQAGDCLGVDARTKLPSDKFPTEKIRVWSVSDTEETSIDIIERTLYEKVLGEDESGIMWNFVDDMCYYDEKNGWRKHFLKWSTGSLWRFKNTGQKIKTFRGSSQHQIWIDEPQPKEYYSECRARVIDTDGYIRWTMTPIIGESKGIPWNYHDHYLKRFTNGIPFHNWTLFDNPYIPESEKKKLVEEWDEDELQARAYGEWVAIGLNLALPKKLLRRLTKEAEGHKPQHGALIEDEKGAIKFFENTTEREALQQLALEAV